MIGTLGLFGTVAGAIVSRIAARLPDHMETLETGAGFLLIAGLALIACALPSMV
jgi:uncharacterized membrane protein YgdD (TMEM256/DUF423 family)